MAIMNKLPNDYAFPDSTTGNGMTLRQWYKGQALAGISISSNPSNTDIMHYAMVVGKIADAMIEEDRQNG